MEQRFRVRLLELRHNAEVAPGLLPRLEAFLGSSAGMFTAFW